MATGMFGAAYALTLYLIATNFQIPDRVIIPPDKTVFGPGLVEGGHGQCGFGAFAHFGHEKLLSHLLSPSQLVNKQPGLQGEGQRHRKGFQGDCLLGTCQQRLNFSASLTVFLGLLVCGDVHPCPGPKDGSTKKSRTPSFPCVVCRKGVIKSSKAVCCDECDNWTHIRCAGVSATQYEQWVTTAADFSFTCINCDLKLLNCIDFNSTGNHNDENDCDIYTRGSEVHDEVSVQANNVPPEPNINIKKCFSSKGLHLLHLNTRSALPKLAEIGKIVRESNASVMALTETWFDESITMSEIRIDGYICVRNDRNRHGGGVCLYIRDNITFNVRSDLAHVDIEAMWVDIMLPKTKPILVGVVYRPPHQNNFYEILEELCSNNASFLEQETILLGDFNTNVLGVKSKDSLLKAFNYFCAMFDAKQIITDCTRVTDHSKTLIDLIVVSDCSKICNSGVLNIGVSDHKLTYCTRKIKKPAVSRHNTVNIRSLKHYDANVFNAKLSQANWLPVLNCSKVDNAWCNFKEIFLTILDSVAPNKTVRLKQRSEPWMDGEILDHIVQRDEMLADFEKTKDTVKFVLFKKLRNKVQRLVNKAKESYFRLKLEENQNYPKKLWENLNSLGAKTKCKDTTSSIGLNIDNVLTFDKLKVANKFNSFFTTVASKLVENLPTPCNLFGTDHVNQFYKKKGVTPGSFKLSVVNSDCVLKHLKSLKMSKATGLDAIPARFLKDGAQELAIPLCHVINLSITQGCVPKDMKMARVVPLYKKAAKTECGNYRPVSILCVISKILERIVHDQIQNYLDENDLLYKFQSGFRKAHSTDSHLIYLTDYIRTEIDNGNYCGMIMLDLQKAFDTVDHQILLSKLVSMGFDPNSTNWMSSYLSEREQIVMIDNVKSSSCSVSCGVPQGSILGPQLFLLYVNDMVAATNCKLMLYADDSALLVSGTSVNQIQITLCKELEAVSNWLTDNKLSLHIGKTESILFGSKQKTNNCAKLQVKFHDTNIHASLEVKYLGFQLDQHLSGNEMASKVIKTVNSRIKFLNRKSKYFDVKTGKLLASALIQCHLDYVSSCWFSGLRQKLKHKLQVCQNKTIRTVLKLPCRSHLMVEHFRKINWLPIEYRVNQLKLCHVKRIVNGEAPIYLSEGFSSVSHSQRTRLNQSHSLVIPRVRTMYGINSFKFTASKLWNALPSDLRQINNSKLFKSRCKEYLFVNFQNKELNQFVY